MQTSLCRFKLRRGKEADRIKITPEEGEPIFSTDVGRLAVGNGNIPGGIPVNKVWTDSVSANTYAVIGDIKCVDDKQYIYKGNNEWVQFGGDGLVAANTPLSVGTNNTVVLNLSSYEGNKNKIDLAVNNGKLIVNAGTLVNEVSTIQDNITNINSNISELSANKIYNSSLPVVIGYSAIYDSTNEEVPIDSIPVDDTLTSAITSLTGKVDNKSYTIDQGIKLLYDTDTFELTNKDVTIISEVDKEDNDSGVSDVKLIKKTETLPHLALNPDSKMFKDIAADVEYLSGAIKDPTYSGVGRNIGDIFYTSRTGDIDSKGIETDEINGAVPCDGRAIRFSDLTGDRSVKYYLTNNLIPYVSKDTYTNTKTTYGSCRCFGWNGPESDDTTFFIPKLNDVYIKCGKAESENEFIQESLPNIRGSAGVSDVLHDDRLSVDGAFYLEEDDIPNEGGGSGNNRSSGVYKDGVKVQPDSVRYRAYIQIHAGTEQPDSYVNLDAIKSYVVSSFYIPSTSAIVNGFPDVLGGASWGRVWSDGWLEQGGFAIGGSQVIYITFSVPFNDTNYNIIVASESPGSAFNYNPGIIGREKSVAGVTWNTMIGDDVRYAKVHWYACGYNKN